MEPSENLTPGLRKNMVVSDWYYGILQTGRILIMRNLGVKTAQLPPTRRGSVPRQKKSHRRLFATTVATQDIPLLIARQQHGSIFVFLEANRSGWEDGYQQRGLKSTVSKVRPGVSDFFFLEQRKHFPLQLLPLLCAFTFPRQVCCIPPRHEWWGEPGENSLDGQS